MLCVSGRAKACLDQFEDSQQEPQKFSTLKEQLKAIFDSPSDREEWRISSNAFKISTKVKRSL